VTSFARGDFGHVLVGLEGFFSIPIETDLGISKRFQWAFNMPLVNAYRFTRILISQMNNQAG
jgi:hypothetical protein